MSIIVSSTTDTPEQVEQSLERLGLTPESVETVSGGEPESASAPAEPAAEDTATEAAGTTADATETPGETQEQQRGQDGKFKPKAGKGIQKRIDDLTREKHEERQRREQTERENADLKRQLEERSTPPAAKPQDATATEETSASETAAETEPQLEAYEDYEGWVKAHVGWSARKTARETIETVLKERDDRAHAREQQTAVLDLWNERVNSARERYADWDEVAQNDVPLTPVLQSLILEAEDRGPDIAYYLATHADEATRLSALNPVAAARAIGRIEATLQIPAGKAEKAPARSATKASSAPPPIKPGNSKSVTSGKDPYRQPMSPAEYREWRAQHPNG